LQLTQALRVTDSGTLRRFEAALLLLLLSAGVFLAASELVDSEDWCGGLVEEGRILRKDIVEPIPIKPCGIFVGKTGTNVENGDETGC
jgi:hypothetical protein